MTAPRRDRVAAVNVDVDALAHYHRLHGLDEGPARRDDAVWTKGVPRFAELFSSVGVKATFFVVAEDLERSDGARAMCEELVRQGHEVASHSYSHPYALTRLPEAEIARELDQAFDVLSDVRGTPIRGFRAPGYTMSPAVFDLLRERGYAYDSSLFPCPPYYLAKAAVMAGYKLTGRTTEAILGPPGDVFTRATQPHDRGGLVELPVTVLPGLRVPVIGTSLAMMGSLGWRVVRRPLQRLPFVNLEFHGIDLCEVAADGLDPALTVQPEQKRTLGERTSLFREVLADLTATHRVATLEALAPRWARA